MDPRFATPADTQAARLDPGFSDQSTYGPPRPAAQEQPSVLDMLRRRVSREMEGQDLQRLSEFGAGMLSSNSPNFFTMLGAGARAQAQGDASRMDRLRQVAEAERQQRALDIEEQRRREELALRRQELEATAPYRAAQAEQARAMARFYDQGGRGGGGARGQLTERDFANLSMRAAQRAATEVPDPRPGSPEAVADTPAAAEARRARREQLAQSYFAAALEAAGRGPAPGSTAAGAPDVRAAPAPAATIDVRGNPTR
jgi:hypothetical protein